MNSKIRTKKNKRKRKGYDEYPLLPRTVKDVLKENKFPIHKINNDLK